MSVIRLLSHLFNLYLTIKSIKKKCTYNNREESAQVKHFDSRKPSYIRHRKRPFFSPYITVFLRIRSFTTIVLRCIFCIRLYTVADFQPACALTLFYYLTNTTNTNMFYWWRKEYLNNFLNKRERTTIKSFLCSNKTRCIMSE